MTIIRTITFIIIAIITIVTINYIIIIPVIKSLRFRPGALDPKPPKALIPQIPSRCST